MHFLIVSFVFPPSKEIGGRRWSKFSKYIYREKHDVTVITSENVFKSNDVINEFKGIDFIYIPSLYPTWLSGNVKNLIEKFLYYIFVFFVNKIYIGNIFDKGIFWKKKLIKKILEINNFKKIDVLIMTGAPFSLLYYGAYIKNKCPNLFYVADFRDPWIESENYGMKMMSKRKFEYQKYLEKTTVYAADLVSLPTPYMVQLFKEKYPKISQKFYLLPHAFDADKFVNIDFNSERNNIIYGGTIYNNTDEMLIKINDVLMNNRELDLVWNIYTNTDVFHLKKKLRNSDRIIFHDYIPEHELFKKIVSSKFYLLPVPDDDKDFIFSKIYEIIYLKTPIICVSNSGELSKFIVTNSLGVHIMPQCIEEELPKVLKSQLTVNGNFPIHEYSFKCITQKFLQTITDRLQ